MILGEAGSLVGGAQEVTMPFSLLLCLFGNVHDNSKIASVGKAMSENRMCMELLNCMVEL